VELLASLQPNQGYMRLFRGIVLDVWKNRQAEAVHVRRAAQARSEALQRRLDEVDEAFIHDKRIDRDTYERQRDRLREDIANAEMECGDAKLEELDVQGVLAFAEHALTNASRLWVDASLDQKQRFQSVMFPDGLRFDGESFGTAVTCLAFSQLPETKVVENSVASPTGSVPYCAARNWPSFVLGHVGRAA
jgi:hypothetical protein